MVVFPSGPNVPYSLTREGQEERIRLRQHRLDEVAADPGPAGAAARAVRRSDQRARARSAGDTWLPVAWRGNPSDEQLFDKVIKPYCATCHLASQLAIDGSTLGSDVMFRSPADMQRFPLAAVVCGQFGMPNAQPTRINFWDPQKGMVPVAGKRYPAAADALLAWAGLDRTSCQGLERGGQLRPRGRSRSALRHRIQRHCLQPRRRVAASPSSAAWLRGRPSSGPAASAGLTVRGFAREPLECASVGNMPEGLSGFDGVCVPSRGK